MCLVLLLSFGNYLLKNKYFTLVVIGRIADALNIDIRQLSDDVDTTK